MSESTSLREAIARALHKQVVAEAQSRRIDIEVHGEGIAFERRLADAVLAVLADPPADVIEQAALALVDRDGFEPETLTWLSLVPYRRDARAAFRAAFGGEQA